jgi:retron-type reverse transcriptase
MSQFGSYLPFNWDQRGAPTCPAALRLARSLSLMLFLDSFQEHWPAIREQLLSGTYAPQPARRVEIAKLDGGGMRKLGIPTTLDRFVQQAVLQVLQRQWDPTFSEHSYGFRPGRSAHQAVAQAQKNIAEGYSWVVDLDLEKFSIESITTD